MNKSTPRERNRHTPILTLWVLSICVVAVYSFLPADSYLTIVLSRLNIGDKVLHFCAYVMLSVLPVAGFSDRRRGIAAGLLMFALGILIEGGQYFSVGRAVEFSDVIANGAGVSCGTLLGLPIRMLIAVL
ncbi:MAG: VanZ family protein [Bryobacteraceae bacterium]